jgi:UDP-glucose 4-epimerase
MMKYFVTGAAGFIGSNLVDRLLQDGNSVVGYDNFSTGRPEFIQEALRSQNFKLVTGDILNTDYLRTTMSGCDFVFHLAANADVRFGIKHPYKDLEQNTIGTHNVLEAMRTTGIKSIAFSSTGSVYGEAQVIPTPENGPFPIQTSLYGASKLAGEGLIQAYCEGFGFQGYIFRFVSILGEHYSHGHIYDFFNNLRANPNHLRILGDGHQRKSFLYIQDCIDAIFLVIKKAQEKVNIFNLGTDEYCQVNDSISWITDHLGLAPKLNYTGGEHGWIGDNPFIFLDTNKIRKLGWKPKLSIQQGIIRTLDYLRANQWLMEDRY